MKTTKIRVAPVVECCAGKTALIDLSCRSRHVRSADKPPAKLPENRAADVPKVGSMQLTGGRLTSPDTEGRLCCLTSLPCIVVDASGRHLVRRIQSEIPSGGSSVGRH